MLKIELICELYELFGTDIYLHRCIEDHTITNPMDCYYNGQ
jgi:hypothetical protein